MYVNTEVGDFGICLFAPLSLSLCLSVCVSEVCQSVAPSYPIPPSTRPHTCSARRGVKKRVAPPTCQHTHTHTQTPPTIAHTDRQHGSLNPNGNRERRERDKMCARRRKPACLPDGHGLPVAHQIHRTREGYSGG